ncbi:hypothetical protein FACS1894125_0240 [Actinomycetota bacterium]|nr:hypothetical protein FACS1894125_0240 [Actinomycetota bacterium]
MIVQEFSKLPLNATYESNRLYKVVLDNRERLYEILSKYNAENLRIFGSVAKGTAKIGSDIDFWINYNTDLDRIQQIKEHGALWEDFKDALGVDVDVIFDGLYKDKFIENHANDEVIFV